MTRLPFHTIGIDLGGTKVAGLLFAPDSHIVARERKAIPSDMDGEGLVRLLTSRVRRLLAQDPPIGPDRHPRPIRRGQPRPARSA